MNASIEPTPNLPALAPSGFPLTYEEARTAIAKCESPLECRTMADKAAAMAVYARMRDDNDLRVRAVRLQAWAYRRWGELDRELYPDRRQENLKQNVPPNCGRPQFDKTAVKRPTAPDGTTEYQRVVSRRLAAIPEAEFTRQVESDRPPNVTVLAELGKQKYSATTHSERINTPEYITAINGLGIFADFCAAHAPAALAKGCTFEEARTLRGHALEIQQWLTRFIDNLSTSELTDLK